MVSPSGEQFEIAFENQRAVVTEVGAGLRAYAIDGRDLIDGYRVDEMATAGRGQVLIPWPNRLQDGSYEFDGSSHQLPLNEPEHSNAIHGFVRWAVWHLNERAGNRVVLGHVVHPRPGYPFTLALRIEYKLSEDGLAVQTTATNVGVDACPYGCGAHPYLTVGTGTVEAVVLSAPARTVLHAGARGIPSSAEHVDGTELDFREPRTIGPARLDHAFTDLARDAAGVARIELANPESGAALTLWLDGSYPYVMLFTGDLPDVQRRGLAVEPMTCPPNAFRSGEGLVRLEPGDTLTSTWGITPRAP